MKKIISILSLVILIASCGSGDKSSEKQNGFKLSGKIKNSTGSISIQEITATGLVFLDSSNIAPDGSFELNGSIPEKTFCTIRLPKGDVIVVIDSTSNIQLDIDADKVENYTVKGSEENVELQKLFLINNASYAEMRKLEEKYAMYGEQVPPVEVQEQIRKQFDSLTTANKAAIKEYILSLQNSMVPYFATSFLMPEADFELFKEIDNKLYPKFSSSKYATALHTRVQDLAKTAIGSEAPDIVLSDPFGKQIAMSSLRGKYVLVDFWASWCRPCREENPNVVKLYNKYKAKGFEIFSVSLDDNRDAWTKAINDDKLLWTHVSDLMKWNSAVVKQYSIEGIPFTVLLDKEGKILGTKLRGEALEEKLKEIFGY
jgi:thiol-disulfide isomerase/thioredoxin